ncbi:MAG TPA: efflux RND transporter periplasmic adaptor subunit [Candidatus Methylacidiphilales bacterium]|nr:efflux RND transporter periplasmic adaptor subunit [Candidatus Methylacidiphilales bacterium]
MSRPTESPNTLPPVQNREEKRGDQPGPAKKSDWFLWISILGLIALGAVGYFGYVRLYAKAAVSSSAAAESPSGGSSSAGDSSSSGRGGGRRGGAANIIRVVIATAAQGKISKYLTALGNVTPIKSATMKPQVSGQLMKVLFNEGTMVRQGDLLVQIDSRPYEVQLAQNQAQLERDQAQFDNDKVNLQRYETLWAQNAIQEQQLATQRALVKQDEATIALDQSQITADKLNITYCNIAAPFAGRVGLRLVDPGNYVQSGNTSGLVIVNQLQPITVVFTITEDDAPSMLALIKKGAPVKVEAYDREMKNKLADGTLLATDNQIDLSTGLLSLKALFQNPNKSLFPNQFVNIRVNLATKENAILVPASAIQLSGPGQGNYVWIYDEDQRTVSRQDVTVGATENYQTEVLTGVNDGDVVVINGVDKLQNGMKVIAQEAGGGKPPEQRSPLN